MEPTGATTRLTSPNATRTPEPNPLIDLVRASVVGDDEAVEGPFGTGA